MKRAARLSSTVVFAIALGWTLTWLHACTKTGEPVPAEPQVAAPIAAPDAKAGFKGEIVIVSFNGKHWGREAQDLEATARILETVTPDLLMLQEVNTTPSGVKAVKRLAEIFSKTTGGVFCVGFSQVPTGAIERYAAVWRSSRLRYVTTSGEVVSGCPEFDVTLPLFSGAAEGVVREPAYGVFETIVGSAKFVAATVHLVPSGKKPQNEVRPMFHALPGKGDPLSRLPTIVMGDFNLSAAHPVFDDVRAAGFRSVLPRGTKTSLRSKKREYANEYDLIFARNAKCSEGDRIDVLALLPDWAVGKIYSKISDHVPVFARCSF